MPTYLLNFYTLIYILPQLLSTKSHSNWESIALLAEWGTHIKGAKEGAFIKNPNLISGDASNNWWRNYKH